MVNKKAGSGVILAGFIIFGAWCPLGKPFQGRVVGDHHSPGGRIRGHDEQSGTSSRKVACEPVLRASCAIQCNCRYRIPHNLVAGKAGSRIRGCRTGPDAVVSVLQDSRTRCRAGNTVAADNAVDLPQFRFAVEQVDDDRVQVHQGIPAVNSAGAGDALVGLHEEARYGPLRLGLWGLNEG